MTQSRLRARTRIICTVAPPTSEGTAARDRDDYVTGLVAAGMDVARINLSHARGAAAFAAGESPDYAVEEDLVARIRAAAAAEGRHVAILMDLQGIKNRLHLPEAYREAGFALKTGEALRVRFARVPTNDEFSCDGPVEMLPALKAFLGNNGPVPVALGDGNVFLRCDAVDGDVVELVAPEDSVVLEGKGMTFRGLALPLVPPLPDKDKVDLAVFAIPALLRGDGDIIALSFTRAATDVHRLREFCLAAVDWFRHGHLPLRPEDAELLRRIGALRPDLTSRYANGESAFPIIAKIESPLGVSNIDDVLDAVDAVMVARGDLGLSCAPEDVPRYQKEILAKARARGRPAVVATQMLESMITDPEPRRPEAADVFNAVLDGADALMLSGETAVGGRPHAAVQTLQRIAQAAERFELGVGGRALALRKAHEETQRLRGHRYADTQWLRITDQLTFEAVRLADDLRAAAIVGATRSGRTIFNLSRYMPRVPVIAIVPSARIARHLAMVRAATMVISPDEDDDVDFEAGLAMIRAQGLVVDGDVLVVVSTRHGDPTGATTVLQVRVVG